VPSNELTEREKLDVVDGMVVTDLQFAIASGLAKRGIDPSRALDNPAPVLDPRGNVLGEEATAWRLEEVQRRLATVLTGEFDSLPPLHEFVAEWVTEQKKDPKSAPWLVLFGQIGCGKTSQALAAVKELALFHARREPSRSFGWHFITHRNYTAAVRQGREEDHELVISRYENAELLVLDDLGDYNTQDFGRAVEATARLINHRNHHRLPTIYTTNLLYKRDDAVVEMERQIGMKIATLTDTLDGRVISRLEEGWTAPLPEVDYRARKGRLMGS
jgi:hypothetical protein